MSSRIIISNCAPTLAGIKTANLFNERFTDKEMLYEEISYFNHTFNSRGITMFPLALKGNRALIYVCRVKDLEEDLKNSLSKELLKQYGYTTNNVFSSIKRLSCRMKDFIEFPHEIGLFLGYPPEDVKGFIDNHAVNYKLLGYWKVYGDVSNAKKTFDKFKCCRKIYLDCFEKGFSLKQLVIKKRSI